MLRAGASLLLLAPLVLAAKVGWWKWCGRLFQTLQYTTQQRGQKYATDNSYSLYMMEVNQHSSYQH